jgi:hypothetical protein
LDPDRTDLKARVVGAESTATRRTAGEERSAARAEPSRGPSVTEVEAAASTATAEQSAAAIKAHYEKGIAAARNHRTAEAVPYFEYVWRHDRNYKDIRRCLFQAYLIQGMDWYTRGQLGVAVECWRDALGVEPSDPRAAHYIERATAELAKTSLVTRR